MPPMHIEQDVDVPCPLKSKLPPHCGLDFPPDLRCQAHGLVPPGYASDNAALVQLEAYASLRNLECGQLLGLPGGLASAASHCLYPLRRPAVQSTPKSLITS